MPLAPITASLSAPGTRTAAERELPPVAPVSGAAAPAGVAVADWWRWRGDVGRGRECGRAGPVADAPLQDESGELLS